MTLAISGNSISFFIEPRDIYGNRCEIGSNNLEGKGQSVYNLSFSLTVLPNSSSIT